MKPVVRPTRQQLDDAVHHKLRDVIAPGLRVLFCGINPGLYSTAVGHHFARPGNRFWPALHRSRFTPRLFHPSEDGELPRLGLGFTNIVARTTASADEISSAELVQGAKLLRRKLLKFQPSFLAVVGLGAYRIAFGQPAAMVGPQPATIGTTQVWLLPNTSGLNAHYQAADLAKLFADLRETAERIPLAPRLRT